MSTQDEMEAATTAASEAFKTWSKTSVLTRQQVMFKYQDLIKQNMVSEGVFMFSFFTTILDNGYD